MGINESYYPESSIAEMSEVQMEQKASEKSMEEASKEDIQNQVQEEEKQSSNPPVVLEKEIDRNTAEAWPK